MVVTTTTTMFDCEEQMVVLPVEDEDLAMNAVFVE